MGVDRVIERIQDAGAAGVLVLLALQFIQVVVAFIPGEVTQMAAGMLYGPLWGSLLILFGCAISSAFVYELVHRLGAPFVKDLISDQHLKKFQDFEKTERLNIIVFILFLIPGLPKDTFTYIVPLTDMKLSSLWLSSPLHVRQGSFFLLMLLKGCSMDVCGRA